VGVDAISKRKSENTNLKSKESVVEETTGREGERVKTEVVKRKWEERRRIIGKVVAR
jgi:hypothetical protein